MTSKSSLPWFKCYPNDWRGDPALRMCSLAARGLWMEMLCVMHESDRPGSFTVKGHAPSPKHAAKIVGCTQSAFKKQLVELEKFGVFSRDPDGVIYSRRMRRDIEKASKDKANGGRGGNPALVRGVNPHDNREDKAQIPEARDQRSNAPSLREGVAPARATHDKEAETYLSESSEPSFRDLASAAEYGLEGNEVWAEWERFRDYNLAHGKGAVNWSAKWRVWLARIEDFRRAA